MVVSVFGDAVCVSSPPKATGVQFASLKVFKHCGGVVLRTWTRAVTGYLLPGLDGFSDLSNLNDSLIWVGALKNSALLPRPA